MSSPDPAARADVAALQALAAKYQTLADLRRRQDSGVSPGTREQLRALAAVYPGCLRELDTLGLDELTRRATRAAQALLDPAAHEPWMDWIWNYHRLMKAALAVRAGQPRPPDLPVDLAQAVVRPAGGRVGPVILRALAQLHGVPARIIADALFPLRRPSPYTLD